MTRHTGIRIDLAALQHNLKQIKTVAPQSAILAMVKANAYGHGLTAIAKALHSADALGVACLDEAVELRTQGMTQPILLLEGFLRSDDLPVIERLQLMTVVHHIHQLNALEHYRAETPVPVWLKIDTGMHRLGIAPTDAPHVWHRLMACAAVAKPLTLMTHFANADDRHDNTTQQQIDIFTRATEPLSGKRSLANSAGIFAWPESHRDWIRPGIALYGVSPFPNTVGEDLGLKPVMTVYAELIAIHHLKAGERVGYGGQGVCPTDMPIGIVSIGYGDGYPRHAPSGTPVLIGDKLVPVIGRISMDMLAVDLRTHPLAQIETPVILWGDGLPVETIASRAQTLAYELLCNMTAPRLKKTFL